MKLLYHLAVTALLGVIVSGCSPKISTTTLNAYTTVNPNIVSYNELTMDLDEEPITYTIDISTTSGRTKLKNINLEQARELALIEAIMANKCATIFQPQYTHLMQSGKVLRVTLYGYPARYKKK